MCFFCVFFLFFPLIVNHINRTGDKTSVGDAGCWWAFCWRLPCSPTTQHWSCQHHDGLRDLLRCDTLITGFHSLPEDLPDRSQRWALLWRRWRASACCSLWALCSIMEQSHKSWSWVVQDHCNKHVCGGEGMAAAFIWFI